MGLFSSPNSLQRWMTGGPEISQKYQQHRGKRLFKPGIQTSFRHGVIELVKAFVELMNHFRGYEMPDRT